jgi:hypothetical protein
MSWQDEEIRKRRDENQKQERERNGIMTFWNKLLAANSKLPPEIRGRLIDHSNTTELRYQCLNGANDLEVFNFQSQTDKIGKISTTLNMGILHICHSDELGLHISYPGYNSPVYTRNLDDSDIPRMLEDLCTGHKSYEDQCLEYCKNRELYRKLTRSVFSEFHKTYR